MGLDPSEDFPVALSSGPAPSKGFGIEIEKPDKVLISRRIVVYSPFFFTRVARPLSSMRGRMTKPPRRT